MWAPSPLSRSLRSFLTLTHFPSLGPRAPASRPRPALRPSPVPAGGRRPPAWPAVSDDDSPGDARPAAGPGLGPAGPQDPGCAEPGLLEESAGERGEGEAAG